MIQWYCYAKSEPARTLLLLITLAFGAQSEKLLLTVIRRAMLYCATGLIAGLVLALTLAKFLSTLIYGVTAWDRETFLLVPLWLIGVAFLAAYLPARRATQMDAMTTLRCQ